MDHEHVVFVNEYGFTECDLCHAILLFECPFCYVLLRFIGANHNCCDVDEGM